MKHTFLILCLIVGFTELATAQRRPNNFPEKTVAESTDAIYTQEDGAAKKIRLDTARKYFAAEIMSITYEIDSTGLNIVDSLRGNFVEDNSGDKWYVGYDKTATRVSGGGGSNSITYVDTSYTSGNAVIFASGTGVTFASNASLGTYTFTIPEGVVIYSATIDADLADDDGNGELFVAFNYTGTRVFNQSLATAWIPYVRIWESGGSAPSRSSPKNILQIPVQGISSVGSGDVEITITNFTTITPNPVLKFEF
jgi:hypothetical protein